jgi:HEAT repeat protein
MKLYFIMIIGSFLLGFVPSQKLQTYNSTPQWEIAQRAFESEDINTLTNLIGKDSRTRYKATNYIYLLVHRGVAVVEETVPNLILVMLTDEDAETSVRATQALIRIGGSQAHKALFEAIRMKEKRAPNVRFFAFQELAILKDKRIEDFAIEALYDPSWRVQQIAATALGMLQSERAVGILIKRLRDFYYKPEYSGSNEMKKLDYYNVPRNIVFALGKIEGPAIPELHKLLKDDNEELRFLVAGVLGSKGENKAVPVLIEIVNKGEDVHGRSYAAQLLGDLKDERAIPVLVEALQDTNTDKGGCVPNPLSTPLAYAAYMSLLEMGVKVRRIYRKDTIDLYQVVDGTVSDTVLLKALNSEDTQKRYEAALELGSMFYEGAVPVLIDMVTNAENYEDRLWAARHLGRIKNKRAIPALIETLKDSYSHPRSVWFRPVAYEAYNSLLKMDVKVEKNIDTTKSIEFQVIEK